jgi:hypothetical protein
MNISLPTRKRIGLGILVLVVLLLLAGALYGWLAAQRMQPRLAALHASGDPTSFRELSHQPPAANDDAAQVLKLAEPRLKSFAREHAALLNSPAGKSLDQAHLPPSTEQVTSIREILNRYPKLTEQLHQAASCSGYRSQIDFSAGYPQVMDELLKPVTGFRTAARFLKWQALLQAADGNFEDAVEAGLALLRLARLYEAEPALVNALVAGAVRGIAADAVNQTLQSGAVSMPLRQRLDQELDRQDDPQRMVRVLKSERALNLTAVQDMLPHARWMPWLPPQMTNDLLDFYEVLIPLANRPWHLSHEAINQLATTGGSGPATFASATPIQLLLPAISAAYEAENRSLATLRALRIVNHLTAYAQDDGRQATGLSDLDLAPAKVEDPFSGRPMRVKLTDSGWVVYSVFKNGVDDGGDLEPARDWGLGKAAEARE